MSYEEHLPRLKLNKHWRRKRQRGNLIQTYWIMTQIGKVNPDKIFLESNLS